MSISTPKQFERDMSGFNSFDTKGNITLERASRTLQKLSDLLHDNG